MDELVIGHPEPSFQAAVAAAVARVLDAHGIEAEFAAAPMATLLDDLVAGRIDMIASVWSGQDGAAIAALDGQVEMLGALYQPQPMWCVQQGAPAQTLDDLLRPEIRDALGGVVIDPGPSAPVAVREIFDAMGLGAAGWRLLGGGLSDLDAACAAKANHVLPLWSPSAWTHGPDALRALADPLGRLGGPQEARLLVRAGWEADPDLIDELSELPLSNRIIGAMDRLMRDEGATAEAAAEAWQRGRLSQRL